jgi:ABC-type polysaccharide transport system permease subunit
VTPQSKIAKKLPFGFKYLLNVYLSLTQLLTFHEESDMKLKQTEVTLKPYLCSVVVVAALVMLFFSN